MEIFYTLFYFLGICESNGVVEDTRENTEEKAKALDEEIAKEQTNPKRKTLSSPLPLSLSLSL